MPRVNTTSFAPPVLRFSIVVLFVWFGLSQITSPTDWVAWVPQWTENFGFSPTGIVLLNGIFETVLGALLAVGYYTRVVALFLSLHLFFITYSIGYNDIGVRDFVLAGATLSLALFEPDQFTLDKRLKRG